MKEILESMSFSDVELFRGHVFEVRPSFGAIEAHVPCAVIRHLGASVKPEESYGDRMSVAGNTTLRSSRHRVTWKYQVDVWIDTSRIDAEILGDESSIISKLDHAFYHLHRIHTASGDIAEVEPGGCVIVDDVDDQTSGLYKIVCLVSFSELVYEENQVQNFTSVELNIESHLEG